MWYILMFMTWHFYFRVHFEPGPCRHDTWLARAARRWLLRCLGTTLWAAWDEDLREVTQFHLIIFNFEAYQDIYRTIADDAINMIDDGNIEEEHRLQTFITIHFFDTADLVDTIGGLQRSLAQLRQDHDDLLRRFEENRQFTGRIMEWIASRDPVMAGPFNLLLRPEDLAPERT